MILVRFPLRENTAAFLSRRELQDRILFTEIQRREYGKTENDTTGKRRGKMGLAVHRTYHDRPHHP
jgi:hypothetical protein